MRMVFLALAVAVLAAGCAGVRWYAKDPPMDAPPRNAPAEPGGRR